MGGMVAAIERGFPQKEIQRAAYDTQLAVERDQQVVVGVNRFQTEEQAQPELLRIDPALEEAQVARRVTRAIQLDHAAFFPVRRRFIGTSKIISNRTPGGVARRLSGIGADNCPSPDLTPFVSRNGNISTIGQSLIAADSRNA